VLNKYGTSPWVYPADRGFSGQARRGALYAHSPTSQRFRWKPFRRGGHHRYGSAPDSRLNEDLRAIDESTEALVKKLWNFSGEDRVSRASFKGIVRGKGINLLMMLYALLRHRNARDFLSDEEIGEDSVAHHIFPRVRLEEYNYKEDEIYDIANPTFI